MTITVGAHLGEREFYLVELNRVTQNIAWGQLCKNDRSLDGARAIIIVGNSEGKLGYIQSLEHDSFFLVMNH